MSEQNILRFDSHLIYCIDAGHNDAAKALLKRKLNDIKDALGLLLHRAALHNNHAIAQHLIELGCDIDLLDYDGNTPLAVALQKGSTATVKVLLEANAKLDIANDDGKSALHLIFSTQLVPDDVLVLFFRRLQRDFSDVEGLAEKLVDAGSTMYHAAFSRDTKLMECTLKRGIDIHSRGYYGVTALHAAVALDDLDLAEWLLNNDADVNAVDDEGASPLYDAAYYGRVDLMRLFLEHGADPNLAEQRYDYTPLFAAFAYSLGEPDQKRFDDCIDLLLQHGAIPRNSSDDRNTLFDYSIFAKSDRRINLLIARLALLDRLGTPTAKSVLHYNKEDHSKAQPQLDKNYELCLELLGLTVYRKLTVFDLLTESEDKLRVHARDEMLIAKINYIDGKLREIYAFYLGPLMKRIAKAVDIVKLEDKAIPILSELFDGNYNRCYDFARVIVRYLNAEDLEQLCRL